MKLSQAEPRDERFEALVKEYLTNHRRALQTLRICPDRFEAAIREGRTAHAAMELGLMTKALNALKSDPNLPEKGGA